MNQLTLNLEPSTAERFPTLRAFVAHRAAMTAKHLKVQAADLDMAPSTLSRKLNPADGDTQRFNVDDLEAWLQSTGEAGAVIEYLASKYMDTDVARRARALSRVEQTMKELQALIPALKAESA